MGISVLGLNADKFYETYSANERFTDQKKLIKKQLALDKLKEASKINMFDKALAQTQRDSAKQSFAEQRAQSENTALIQKWLPWILAAIFGVAFLIYGKLKF